MIKMDYIKNTFYIILSLATLGGIVFSIDKYFAKTSQVESKVIELKANDESLAERLDISIEDDRIYQQQQQISRIKDLTTIERKERDLTNAEEEILREKKKRLEELKKAREQKLEYYRNRRKK